MITALGKRELIALLFFFLFFFVGGGAGREGFRGLCTLCHELYALPLCVIGSLYSVIAAFPGYLYNSSLSLSRPRLSRITGYLEVKFWSLFKYKNLTTGNKILWKRGGAISPLFHNIFNISLTSGVKLHIQLLNVVIRFFFPQIFKFNMSRYGYLEIFQRVPWNSR